MVEQAPQRVATYGGGDVDTLLALGITPVLVPDIDPRWKKTGGVAPWSRSRVRGEAPVVASNEALEFEKVAARAARPHHRGRVRPQEARLRQALRSSPRPSRRPRASRPTPCRGTRWRVQVGASLGRRADAEGLVKATRDRIAAAAKANPKFAASKAVLIDPDDDGGVYIFAENDVRTRFLGDLGFTMPAEIERLFKGQFYAQISAERLDLLDTADVLVLVAVAQAADQAADRRRAATRRCARCASSGVARIDEPDLAIAMSYSSVLSTPYQLREVVPRLRAALA